MGLHLQLKVMCIIFRIIEHDYMSKKRKENFCVSFNHFLLCSKDSPCKE